MPQTVDWQSKRAERKKLASEQAAEKSPSKSRSVTQQAGSLTVTAPESISAPPSELAKKLLKARADLQTTSTTPSE